MKFSLILSEGRREQLFQKYMGDFKPEVLDIIFNDEFSKRTNYKYVDWILTNLDFDETPEAHEIMDLVKEFDRLGKNLEKKDINQYSDVIELSNAIESYTSKSQEKKIDSDAKKIYEDERVLIVKPLSHKASCKYGAGTKWCTTEKSPGYYDKHTAGGQALYYVIMKEFDISNKFYKIALHLSLSGYETWWDSKDTSLPPREIELLKTGLGKTAIKNINTDFFGDFQDIVKKIFNPSNVEEFVSTNVKNSGKDLKIIFTNPVVVEGKNVQIDIEVMIDSLVLDKLMFKGTYHDETSSQDKYLAVYGELDGDDNIAPIFNIFDLVYSEKIGVFIGILNKNPFHTLCLTIFDKIKSFIVNDMTFMTKVLGLNEPKVSNRYGFTFEKSPLIKKLIEYIDSGNEGDKLKFFIDSGILTVSQDNEGNPQFLNKKGNKINPRGYLSSFFAAAAGSKIIGYKKIGRKKIMVKGPNFEVFKKKYFD